MYYVHKIGWGKMCYLFYKSAINRLINNENIGLRLR